MSLKGNMMDPMQQMQKLREARSMGAAGRVCRELKAPGSTEKEALWSARLELSPSLLSLFAQSLQEALRPE